MLEVTDKEKTLVEELQKYIVDIKHFSKVAIRGMTYVSSCVKDYDDKDKYKAAKKIYEALSYLEEIPFSINFTIGSSEAHISVRNKGTWRNIIEYTDLLNFIISLQRAVCTNLTIINTSAQGYDPFADSYLSRLSKIIDDYLNV